MTMKNAALWSAAAVAAMAIAGCGGNASEREGERGDGPGRKVEVSAAVREQARQTFANRCSVCHGREGRGDGPGAAGLTPPPRNYHDAAWQASVTDDQIEKAIVYGGAAVGKSPAMVANPDLGNNPEMVAALREIVREFGKQ